MAKKISANQLKARKRQGAKSTKKTEEVVVQRFDELLTRLDRLEALTKERTAAQSKLYESLEKLVSMRGEVELDLSPLTKVLERIEALSESRASDYEFTFKHRADGRYDKILAKALPPTRH